MFLKRLSLKQIIADSLTVKTARVNDIEMVDSANGDIYCTWIANGEMQKVKGDCATVGPGAQTAAVTTQAGTTSTPESNTQNLRMIPTSVRRPAAYRMHRPHTARPTYQGASPLGTWEASALGPWQDSQATDLCFDLACFSTTTSWHSSHAALPA